MAPTDTHRSVDLVGWLRDHLLVLDEGEPAHFEVIKDSVCDVIDRAISEADYAGTTDSLIESVQQLQRAYAQRQGTGSKT